MAQQLLVGGAKVEAAHEDTARACGRFSSHIAFRVYEP